MQVGLQDVPGVWRPQWDTTARCNVCANSTVRRHSKKTLYLPSLT
ncbi:hypothetical protein FOCC_FOCC002157 [Frankliniella occidentalis]|nr:hypothetical protein FOCC_FOCC002157 [Frankliniella occidentalis]